jgi:hypothetical protein
MRGSRWTARVRAENTAFHKALSDVATKDEIEMATTAFKDAYFTWERSCEWIVERGAHKIYVYPQEGGEVRWAWEDESHPISGDLDITENGIVVYSTDMGMGEYSIIAEKRDTKLWTHDGSMNGLAPELAILGKRVFMVEASSNLQYDSLVSVDLLTGKDRRIHYKEKDPSYALTLVKGENGCLFLLSENAGTQNLYYMDDGNLKRLSEESNSFFPVGFAPNSKEPCYFTRENNMWEPHGAALKSYKLPGVVAIDNMILRNRVLIHRSHGERCIDLCGRRKGAKRLAKVLGEVFVHPWNIWYGTGPLPFHLIVPGRSPIRAVLGDTLCLEPPKTIYANKIMTGMTPSADGTLVRWLVVYNDNRPPKAVIITAYGAYNTPTSLDTTRWAPFLASGFAIGFALVRGGGDHDDEWADAARVHKKYVSVEDLEACIRIIRSVLHLGARHTCIFGRSAGGYLVGAAATRHPDGELFGSIYTESPYVDVLSTASNPQLPLTKYEYLEFGNPLHVIADFETLLRLGPITGLDEKGAPGLFVICRAGLNDRQVYAYESVKWMDALRGKKKGEPKLLEIIKEDGHFSRGFQMYAERASDFLLLSKRILG